VAAAYLAPWGGGIEGAYFDRSVAAPAMAGYVNAWGAWWVPSALLGAGVALVLCAAVLAALTRRFSRRATS
jgi:hypothetical protein